MAHEVSITVEFDGRFVNLPTVVRGKSIGGKEAVRRFRAGELSPLGGRSFESEKSAVAAAKRRSNPTKRPGRNPFKEIR